jgi:hypothetical protein
LYGGPERLTPHFGPRRRRSFTAVALQSILRDRWLIAFLVFALVINAALWLFLVIRFPELNDLLPLHFDAQGFPDRIDSKNGIFALPTIGLFILLTNTVLALLAQMRERAAGILLAVGAGLAEIFLWIATLNIVGGFS